MVKIPGGEGKGRIFWLQRDPTIAGVAHLSVIILMIRRMVIITRMMIKIIGSREIQPYRECPT